MAYNTPPPFVVTTDNYQYLSCPGSAFVQSLVLDAGILIGFGKMVGSLGPESATYDVNDQPLLPGSNPIPQACDAIRYKSMTRGVPARVAISARPNRELPKDVALQTAYVPSYLVLNPDGTIGANFSGHVQAQGIDLEPSLSDTIVDGDNRLNWIQNGSAVYDGLVYVSKTGANDRRMQLGTFPFARPSPIVGTPTSGIDILDWQSRSSNSVGVFTRNQFRYLLDDLGQSSYVQWGPGFPVQSPLMIQLDTTVINCAVVGQQAIIFNVGPWRSHSFTLAWVVNVNTSWPTIRGCVAWSNSSANVIIDSPTIQNVTIAYMSVGIYH